MIERRPDARALDGDDGSCTGLRWLTRYAAADVGIEGIVAEGLGQAYRGGRRDWLKYRFPTPST